MTIINFNDTGMVGYIKSARMHSLDHMHCMPPKDNVKRVFDSNAKTSRPVLNGWTVKVYKDFQRMNGNISKELMSDCMIWRRIVKKFMKIVMNFKEI